jgi:hypothetical protein
MQQSRGLTEFQARVRSMLNLPERSDNGQIALIYSGFQSHGVHPLVLMPYAPRPDPTRMYSSQPGTAISGVAMTELLERAIARLQTLPESEQKAISSIILDESDHTPPSFPCFESSSLAV